MPLYKPAWGSDAYGNPPHRWHPGHDNCVGHDRYYDKHDHYGHSQPCLYISGEYCLVVKMIMLITTATIKDNATTRTAVSKIATVVLCTNRCPGCSDVQTCKTCHILLLLALMLLLPPQPTLQVTVPTAKSQYNMPATATAAGQNQIQQGCELKTRPKNVFGVKLEGNGPKGMP